MIAKSLQNALSSVALMVALVLFSACGRQEVLTGDFSLVSPLPQMIFAGGGEASFVISSRHHILGIEACIWTERVADTDSLEWRLLPRLSTLSEIQWSDPAAHEWDTYLLRLRHMSDLYRSRGWNARER